MIKEAVISPSGDFLVVNVAGAIFCLLDAHTLQMISMEALINNGGGSTSLLQLSHIHFLNEHLLVSVEQNANILLWRMDSRSIFPVAYLDCMDVPPEEKDDLLINKIFSYTSSTKAIAETMFRGKFWTKSESAETVTYDSFFDQKALAAWFSFDPSNKPEAELDEVRETPISLLFVLDNQMSLSAVWTDVLLAMYGHEPSANTKRDHVTVGYTLSTEKLIQGIKHNAVEIGGLVKIASHAKMKIDLEGKAIADIVIGSFAGQRVMLVLYLNLQFQILSFDLMVKGFMEHRCYNSNKK